MNLLESVITIDFRVIIFLVVFRAGENNYWTASAALDRANQKTLEAQRQESQKSGSLASAADQSQAGHTRRDLHARR